MKINSNVTGKENRKFESSELLALADDAEERQAPTWVSRELRAQASQSFFPFIRG